MSKPKIALVIGSTRANRFADKPVEWFAKIAAERDDLDLEILDLRDFPLPFFDEVASSLYAPSKSEVASVGRRRSPPSTASFSSPPNTAAARPPCSRTRSTMPIPNGTGSRSAFVGYGGVGGARAIEQLRLNVNRTADGANPQRRAYRMGRHGAGQGRCQEARRIRHLNSGGRKPARRTRLVGEGAEDGARGGRRGRTRQGGLTDRSWHSVGGERG